MIDTIRYYARQVFETCRAFFQENNPLGSSKRLIAIASFFSGIFLCWVSLITGLIITDNVLYLAISIIGLATGNYVIGSKKKMKEDVIGDQKTEEGDKNG